MEKSFLAKIHVLIVFFFFSIYEIYKMFPRDPVISYSPFFTIILCALIILFSATKRFYFFKSLFLSFILLNFFIVFLSLEHSLFSTSKTYLLFVDLCIPLLLFFFSYHLTLYYKNDFILVMMFSLVCLFFTIYIFCRSANYDEILQTSSGSYTILYFLPFVLCLKSKFLKTIALIMIAVSVLLSFKRGGTICLTCGLSAYMIVFVFQSKNWLVKTRRLLLMFVLLFVTILGVNFFNNYFDGFLFYRFSTIEAGGGSGRDNIYITVIEMIKNSSSSELLWGHGWNTVVRDNYLGFSAHNDFLECIYDFGIITFFAYISLYICLISFFINLLKKNSPLAAPFMASITMFLSNSIVSHILLYNWFFAIFTSFWGYALARNDLQVVRMFRHKKSIS